MKFRGAFLGRRAVKEEGGQVFAVTALGVLLLVGLAGIAIEVGHGYYALELLQASTNSAALAAAAGLPNQTTATNLANNYSSLANDENQQGILQNVSVHVKFQCLSSVSGLGTPCETDPGGAGTANAVRVIQTATTGLWIGRMFGTPLFNLSAMGSAALQGGQNIPWNIAVIMDTTGSMSGSDSGVQCSGSQEHCALLGFQQLMQDLDPCGRGQTCTSSSSTPVDSLALFVFPAVTTATAGKDYGSPSCGSPSVVQYTFSNVTPGTSQNLFLPTGDTYQIYPVPSGTTTPTPFDSEYLTTDGGGLRSADPLVIASGANTCSGLGDTGGAQTYYAQVIYTAQAALVAQQKASPGSTNAIILLTDGDATACGGSTANTSAGACSSTPANIQAVSGTLNGTGTSSTNPTGYQSPTYPSVLGTCGQAVQAAKDVATSTTINNAGSFTKFITIGYGTQMSGCNSDKTYSNTVTNAGGNKTWKAGDTPCDSIAAMADSSADFYSDNANGCKATDTTNASFTSLTQIFDKIAGQLSAPRLIPNGLT